MATPQFHIVFKGNYFIQHTRHLIMLAHTTNILVAQKHFVYSHPEN